MICSELNLNIVILMSSGFGGWQRNLDSCTLREPVVKKSGTLRALCTSRTSGVAVEPFQWIASALQIDNLSDTYFSTSHDDILLIPLGCTRSFILCPGGSLQPSWLPSR